MSTTAFIDTDGIIIINVASSLADAIVLAAVVLSVAVDCRRRRPQISFNLEHKKEREPLDLSARSKRQRSFHDDA